MSIPCWILIGTYAALALIAFAEAFTAPIRDDWEHDA